MRDLAARPNIDEVMARYDEMLTRMRSVLSTEFGPGTWSNQEGSTSSRTSIDDPTVEARRGWSGVWTFTCSIAVDAESKSRALAAVSKIGRANGFVDLVVFVDREGEIQAVADDEFGGRYYVGAKKNTVLRYVTAVHRSDGATDEDEPTSPRSRTSPAVERGH